MVVISEWIERLTLNIITKMIAGKRYFGNSKDRDDEETKHIAKTNRDFMYLAAAPVLSDLIPLLRWGDLQGQLESMKSIAREFDDLVGSWIEEHMRRLKSEPSNETDFIDVMLSVIEEDNLFGHTREQIVRATAVVCQLTFLKSKILYCWLSQSIPFVDSAAKCLELYFFDSKLHSSVKKLCF